MIDVSISYRGKVFDDTFVKIRACQERARDHDPDYPRNNKSVRRGGGGEGIRGSQSSWYDDGMIEKNEDELWMPKRGKQ